VHDARNKAAVARIADRTASNTFGGHVTWFVTWLSNSQNVIPIGGPLEPSLSL